MRREKRKGDNTWFYKYTKKKKSIARKEEGV